MWSYIWHIYIFIYKYKRYKRGDTSSAAATRQHAALGSLHTDATLPSRAPATHLVRHLCHSAPMWQVVALLLWRERRRGKRERRKVILGVNAPWTSLGAAGPSPHTPLGSGVVTGRGVISTERMKAKTMISICHATTAPTARASFADSAGLNGRVAPRKSIAIDHKSRFDQSFNTASQARHQPTPLIHSVTSQRARSPHPQEWQTKWCVLRKDQQLAENRGLNVHFSHRPLQMNRVWKVSSPGWKVTICK